LGTKKKGWAYQLSARRRVIFCNEKRRERYLAGGSPGKDGAAINYLGVIGDFKRREDLEQWAPLEM